MKNDTSAEPEHKDVHIKLDVVPGPIAQAIQPEVKVEIDRIAQIVERTEQIANDTKQIAQDSKDGVEETKEGVKWTKIGIGFAIALSLLSMALQYLKIT